MELFIVNFISYEFVYFAIVLSDLSSTVKLWLVVGERALLRYGR